MSRFFVPVALGLIVSAYFFHLHPETPSDVPMSEAVEVTEGGCGAGCEHHHRGAVSRVVVQLEGSLPWVGAKVGDRVELGFELGGMATGKVTMVEQKDAERVATAIQLPSGDDLFIVRGGSEWEGRVIPRSGGSGWRILGNDLEATIEELERGAMICSWTMKDGAEVAGLPPVYGTLLENSASALEVGEAATTLLLESLPGANGVIYLDFDGETVSGTAWNSSYNSSDPIVAAASGFSDSKIQTVWRGVSEDYRPFNVNVTTDRSVYDSYPISRRAMLVFTPSNEWYGRAGGVAYVNVFGSSSFDAPGWVFTDQLANSANYASEAASHEAGHILGMRHDGTSSLSYYEGHGSGSTSWAPIMGVGYYSTVTQWSKGEYADANRFEDDLAIITSSRNGLGYRGDDHQASVEGATQVSQTVSDQIEAEGVIEQSTDVDLFSVQAGDGEIAVTVNNASYDPNLDIRLRLLDSVGQELLVADPTSSLDASFTMDVSAGTYHVEVSGTGTAEPGSSTGFTDYGSLGAYTISGTVPQGLQLAAEIISPAVEAISLAEGTGLSLDGMVVGGDVSWEVVSLPAAGSVAFSSSSEQSTDAVFAGVGIYVLRLKGAAGVEEEVDDLTVAVEASGSAPIHTQVTAVDLGEDRTIYGNQISLTPEVTGGSGSRTYEWSVLAGDGQLSSTSIEAPEVTFPSAGPTELRLLVDDGVARTFGEVILSASFGSETLVSEDAAAKALVVSDGGLGSSWHAVEFDDAAWLSGQLGAGYDASSGANQVIAPLIGAGLDLESEMYQEEVGCFVRVPFEVADPNGVLSMNLRIKFDDGFVAYINGVEVARSNVPDGEPSWDTAALSDRSDAAAETAVVFDVDVSTAPLVSGANVLAIHGMNSSAAPQENTFLLAPELEAVITETPYYSAVSLVGDPLLRDPADDADGDGRLNLYEHAAGTDLAVVDEGGKLLELISATETSLVLPEAAPDDVCYVLEYCPDLNPPWFEVARKTGTGSWSGSQPIEVVPLGDGREEVRFNTSDGPTGFFRLKLELVSP